ncbi:unnamed protein product [Xylocopa violacea]|uniref:Transcription factor TFIIIC triple barrel domain-containing protein n=1 Tax=Xylocopa violacea TaxID=135666 RepID=A0ABP1P4F3_XYLVO
MKKKFLYTAHPIMQINGKFYEGAYEDVCGTYMFFTKNDNSVVDDPVFDVAPNFKYFAKTRKFLKMQRIFIKSRTEVLGDSEHNQCVPNLNTLKQAGIPFQYQKEAFSFWETMRNNRLKALHSYLEKQRVRQEKKSQGIMLESESDEDNPFAMYKHKEEFSNSTKPENIDINSERESSSCNNQVCPKFIHPKEINEKNSDIIKSDDDNRLIRSIKGYKVKASQRRKLTLSHNRKRIKLEAKQILLKKDNVSSSDTLENELSIPKVKSGECSEHNVTETFSSLEINETSSENDSEA